MLAVICNIVNCTKLFESLDSRVQMEKNPFGSKDWVKKNTTGL